jgi:hypothetical protein
MTVVVYKLPEISDHANCPLLIPTAGYLQKLRETARAHLAFLVKIVVE